MDLVKVYTEKMISLWTAVKKIFELPKNNCTGDCNQGRNCDCGPKKNLEFSDSIIKLHELAGTIDDPVERMNVISLANELAIIGNRLHEKNLKIRNPKGSPRK